MQGLAGCGSCGARGELDPRAALSSGHLRTRAQSEHRTSFRLCANTPAPLLDETRGLAVAPNVLGS